MVEVEPSQSKVEKDQGGKNTMAAFGHDLAESPVDVGEDESLVGELDDDELYVRLRQFGVDVGPVVESTRHLYRKKLASLMRSGGGEDPAAHSDRGGDVGQFVAEEEEEEEDDLSSDDDEQPAPVVTRSEMSPRYSTDQQHQEKSSEGGGSLRQRFMGSTPEDVSRPSRSYKVTESSRQTLTQSADGRQLSHDYSYQKEVYRDGVKVEGERGKSSMLSIAIKALVFILVLLAMAYVGIKYFQCEEKLWLAIDRLLALVQNSQVGRLGGKAAGGDPVGG